MATYNKQLAEAKNGSLHVVIDGELHLVPQNETELYKEIVGLREKVKRLEDERVDPHETMINKIVSNLKQRGLWINE